LRPWLRPSILDREPPLQPLRQARDRIAVEEKDDQQKEIERGPQLGAAVLGDQRLLCGDSSKPEDVDRLLDGAEIHLCNTDPPYNVKVEPRSNNAIAAGLSSHPNLAANPRLRAGHGNAWSYGIDHETGKTKGKMTHKKLRAKDRPLENDFVSDEEFDRLLAAWFGNIA